MPISSLFCAICLSELRFQFYSIPLEAFGGHGGRSEPGEHLGPRPSLGVSRCPRRIQGCLYPLVEDVPSLVLAPCPRCPLYSCTGLTGGLCFGVCNAGKEKPELQLLIPPLKEPHGHLFIRRGKGHFPSVAGARALALSCSRSTKTRGHPRHLHPSVSQECLQPRWFCRINGLWPTEQMLG